MEDDQGSDSSSRRQHRAAEGRHIDNQVIVRTTLKGRRLYLHRLEQLARGMLADHGVSGAELSILIAGDHMLRRLNRQYRDIAGPTDVLAFPQDAPYGPAAGVKLLGDVVVSADRAAVQARAAGRPVRDELMLLVAHGVLHLLGYDHQKPDDEAKMRAAEQAALDSAFSRGKERGT